MKQDAFSAFYAPQEAPISGLTPEAQEASRSGAEAAERVRGRHLERIRNAWHEAHTLNEIADLTGLPLGSVCSLKRALETDLEWVDYVKVDWGELDPIGRRKVTRRSRWKLRSARRDG